MAHIFLCHASEDKPQVREVYQRLKALGFSPWLDEEAILPGQDWDYEIEQALEDSDFVMVFLSTRSVSKAGYVQREFRRALYHSEEIPEGQIHTIPVKLDNCEVPRRFSRHQWADLAAPGAFERIVQALHVGLEQRGLPAPEPQVAVPPVTPPAVEDVTGLAAAPEPVDAAAPVVSKGLEEWTNRIGMVFVRIPAGSFTIGSPQSDREAFATEQPAHPVEITQPFYLGKYPVTQSQWEVVMGDNPSRFSGHPNRPVENVSWADAQRFMAALNKREGVSLYRLPTEAQWEYACRAGTEGPRYHADLDAIAWYDNNSQGQTHEVGQKVPNTWGLHDMLGNVYEWCDDGQRDYTDAAMTDPVGPTDAGADRVIRGGCWGNFARRARSAFRSARPPGARYGDLGFRCLSSGKPASQ